MEQPCLLRRVPAHSVSERGYATVVEVKAASERCVLGLNPVGSVDVLANARSATGKDGAIGGSPQRREEGSRRGRPRRNKEGLGDSKGEK